VAPFTFLFFSLYPLLSFIGVVAGIVLLFNKTSTLKLAGVAMTLVFGALVWYFMSGFASSNPIAPEVFQSFNPLFIVALTFPVMGVFHLVAK
jgi:proton-dependent oligopeptide transporter, POT family